MAYKLGLKLWSINTNNYYEQAKVFYENKVFDYIELYVVPNTLLHLEKWKRLAIPFIIHCPHFAHGFNLAQAEKKTYNQSIFSQVQKFADELNAPYIVVHGGIDGTIEETARQFAQLRDCRAVIENKPMIAIPNKMGGKYCRGFSPQEIQYVQSVAHCGFCLDFGHAVCAAISQSIDPYDYINEFIKLNPQMFHLTDNVNVTTGLDTHEHLGTGELDFAKIRSFLPDNAIITLETDKDSKENISDFQSDCEFMRKLQHGI